KEDHQNIVDVEDDEAVEIVDGIDDEMNEGGKGDRIGCDVGEQLPPADEAVRRGDAGEEQMLRPCRKPRLALQRRSPRQKLLFRRHASKFKNADALIAPWAVAERRLPAMPINSDYYPRLADAAKRADEGTAGAPVSFG